MLQNLNARRYRFTAARRARATSNVFRIVDVAQARFLKPLAHVVHVE
jgi:hypothetical protein